MTKKIKAKGTLKRPKNDGRHRALQMLRMKNNPPLNAEQDRERIVRILLNGLTVASSGSAIATYYIRGEPEERRALSELASWLRSDEPPPNDILKRLGDLIDPDITSLEPQIFKLAYRKAGIGKGHKAQTNKSKALVKLLVDSEIGWGSLKTEAFEKRMT
jgi:hypothetical protein